MSKTKTVQIALAIIAGLAVLSLIIFKPAPSPQSLAQARAELTAEGED